jgi:hypothetical protein
MTLRLALGLVLSLVSACAINWGYLAQHGVAGSLPRLSLRHPIRSLWSLFRNLRWLVGFGVGVSGWVLYVAALALAPLSLVQAVSAGGIGILALLVWRATGVMPSRREWTGVACAVGGLAVIGASLAGQRAGGTHGTWTSVSLWFAASLAGSAVAVTLGPRLLAPGAGLGIVAGVMYAAGDVGTKAAVGGGGRLLFALPVFASHGLAFVALQLGFQRGGALATAGVATLFTNALPIVAGIALFREPLPGGALGVLRVIGFAAVIVGAAVLARGEPVVTAAGG